MNRFEIIKQTVGKSIIEDWFIRNRSLPGMEDKELFDLPYSKSDLVYICISTTARAISQVPLIVQYQTPDGWEPVPEDNVWQRLFTKPNQYLDQYSFLEALFSNLLLDGDTWIIQFPLNTDTPTDLYVVPKKNMEEIIDKETRHLIGWKYKPSVHNAGYNIELKDVAHSFLWNPYDPIYGISPIEAGRISIATDYKAAMFNKVFFKNNASFGGALYTEQRMGDKQYNRLKEEIEDKYSGYEQAHKPLLLDQGLKYQQTIPSHKDMLFRDLRSLDKERVLQVFGMKKSIISVTDDLNYATSKEQRKSWWQDTNLPLMRLLVSAINFTFLERRGLKAIFDTSSIEALQEDFNEKVETAERLYKMNFTPNEINERLELGFEAADWRDYTFIQSSLVPVGPDVDLLGEDEPEPVVIEPEEEPEELPEPEEDEDEEETTLLLNNDQRLIEYKDNFLERAIPLWKTSVRRNANLEEKFRKKTSRMFFDLRKDVLRWLFSQAAKQTPFELTRPITDIDELSVKPLDALKAEADALYEASLISGIETLALELPTVLDLDILSMPEAKRFLQDKLLKLSGINETMTKRIKGVLVEGLEQGYDVETIAANLKWEFKKAVKRARTIARTEVYGANNFARSTGIRESGYKEQQWFTALDELVRKKPPPGPNHVAMHGRIKRVNQMWNLPSGYSIRYPGDYLGPAAEIINCRCMEFVVLSSLNI